MEIRGEEPRLAPEGNTVIVYYNRSNPFKFHLEQVMEDRGMERIGMYRIILAAVASAVCILTIIPIYIIISAG